MIQSLQIRNLAVVENIHIEFQSGFNVITGETGAGKSILIGALGLVLGDRADRDMIRAGEDSCSVEAGFHLRDTSRINSILDEYGIAPCEEGVLIVRRTISRSGPGRILINDAGVTLQALKRVGDLLVDFHGPHEHQSLVRQDFQLMLLDDYGALGPDRASYAEKYGTVRELEKKRDKLLAVGDENTERRIEMLEFQANEIEKAVPDPDEEEMISREHAVAGNAQRILELTQDILNVLSEAETSAFSNMAVVQRALEELDGLTENASDWKQEARSIAVQMQELANDITGFAQGIDQDPTRLQWLDERIAAYRTLKRKYGGSVKDVLEHLRLAKEELKELYSREERIRELDAELETSRERMKKSGMKLSRTRKETAKRLSAAVSRELRELGFARSEFDITLRAIDPDMTGMDEADFRFAPNKGEPTRPIRVIASSGEISRLVLAIKSVLAKQDRIPVLVFDEIDVNIGGATARAVGLKLAGLAARRQVLCITHLPQVAVHGKSHFSVVKTEKKGRTITVINKVEAERRAEEIARMLGGRDSTTVAMKHARELLDESSS